MSKIVSFKNTKFIILMYLQAWLASMIRFKKLDYTRM